MSAADPFFDTNVLLYLLSADTKKADRVERLLAEGGVVSVQLLSDFTSVARRKLDMSWEDIAETLGVVRELCRVEPLTAQTFDSALELAVRYELSWSDAMIVSAARAATCKTLYTEDMHPGLTIDGLKLVNPFR